MKVLVFTKNNLSYSEEQAIGDFERTLKSSDCDVEKVDLEEQGGSLKARVYDIFTAPSVIITTNDGAYIHGWLGSLPTASEVKHYIMV